MKKETEIICTNIFKNSDQNSLRKTLTDLWIQLINYKEKSLWCLHHDK